MVITEEQKEKYVARIHTELMNRGMTKEDAIRVIGKTGFNKAMQDYPDVQMHYSVRDAVNEILCVAAIAK